MELPEIPDGELEYGYQPRAQLQIPPELVTAVAQGMVDPAECAAKLGLDAQKWAQISVWPPFIAAVEAHRAELAASGYTFRVKAKFMAEELAEKTFVAAMGPDATFAQRFQATQFFTRVGGLEPKEEKVQQTGEGFSVTINMNGSQTTVSGNSPRHSDVIDVPSHNREGYMIAPLIDPSLFAEMAENQDDT
jgi:hypothetical protein